MTPNNKALVMLSMMDWPAGPVETRQGPITKDWLGFGDVAAFHDRDPRMLVVQATSKANVSARVKKILENQLALRFVRASHYLEIWGFSKDDNPKLGQLSRAITLLYSEKAREVETFDSSLILDKYSVWR